MKKIRKDNQLVAIGKRIRQLRIERGFTQEGFAATTGLDRAYYGSVERGERNIAALNLVRIARALNVEVGKLFPSVERLSSDDKKINQE